MRSQFSQSGLWVIKIGSAILTDGGRGIKSGGMVDWVRQIATLKANGYRVILVSSGAIAEGVARLGWTARPHELHKQQAAAAIGQAGLIQAYETLFATYHIQTAQVLLTHDDIANRKRYLNAKSAMKTLLDLDVVPIVNENDTVSIEEIRFGDNDSLAGLVADLMDADVLVILTDQAGMYDKNPSQHMDAILLSEVDAEDKSLDSMASDKGGDLGKGGMASKLLAARIAGRGGVCSIIADGNKDDVLLKITNGENIGTLFKPNQKPLQSKARWLAGQNKTRGNLYMDDGAIKALHSGKSLLSVGVTRVERSFHRGDLVSCLDGNGVEIARGLVNYGAQDCTKLVGVVSSQIKSVLGFIDEHELIHRDNMVLLKNG